MQITPRGLELLVSLAPPSLIYSCVLDSPGEIGDTENVFPSLGEDPGGEIVTESSGVLLPPGFDPAALPVAPPITDTSPSQMIGCLSDGQDDPPYWLGLFFPLAEEGDGVIERSTSFIWVFRGGQWVGLGDTPGETIESANPIEPYDITIQTTISTRNVINATSQSYIALETREAIFSSRNYIDSSAGLLLPASNHLSCEVSLAAPDFLTSTRRGAANDFQYIEYTGIGQSGRRLTSAVVRTPRIFLEMQLQRAWSKNYNNYGWSWIWSWSGNGFVNSTPAYPAIGADETGYVLVNGVLDQNGFNHKLFLVGGGFAPVEPVTVTGAAATVQTSGSVSSVIVSGLAANSPCVVQHRLNGVPSLVIFRRLSGSTNNTSTAIFGAGLDAATGASGSGFPMSQSFSNNTTVTSAGNLPFSGAVTVDESAISFGSTAATSFEMLCFAEKQNSIKTGFYVGTGLTEWENIEIGFSPEMIFIWYVGTPAASTTYGSINSLPQVIARQSPWVLRRTADPTRALLFDPETSAAPLDKTIKIARLTQTGFQVRTDDVPQAFLDQYVSTGSHQKWRELCQPNLSGGRYFYIAFGGANSASIVTPNGLEVAPFVSPPDVITGLVVPQPSGLSCGVTVAQPRRVGELPLVDMVQGLVVEASTAPPEIEVDSTTIGVQSILVQVSTASPVVSTAGDDRTFGLLELWSDYGWELLGLG